MVQVAVTAPTTDWNSKALFDDFKIFRNHFNRIFAWPLSNATQTQKINYLFWWAGHQAKIIVANNHQVDAENDTFDTYYQLFEAHIRPISKFWAAHHWFYQF